MTDERALTITTIGMKQVYPVTYMVNMAAGLNEHHGNLVGYLRAKGITPPSTARSLKAPASAAPPASKKQDHFSSSALRNVSGGARRTSAQA